MPLYHIIILAIIQGLTEFLPVSSSGHLLLTHTLLGEQTHNLCWQENRLIDVAVHVGTLISVLIYFRKDLSNMVCNITNLQSSGFQMMRNIFIAPFPIVIAGFILHEIQPSFLCMIQVMAWTTLIFGVVLWISDKFPNQKNLEEMSGTNAFIIGLSQTLALIPGVSRSGITMTSARFLGFTRTEAARFSLLLSIVAISGAGFLNGMSVVRENNFNLGIEIVTAIILSAIAGLIAIHFMMKWLSYASFKEFSIYRIILGIILLGLIYGNII